MNRIVCTQNEEFLGLSLKGRLGTVIKTKLTDKQMVHHVKWDGIPSAVLVVGVKFIRNKTMPVMG